MVYIREYGTGFMTAASFFPTLSSHFPFLGFNLSCPTSSLKIRFGRLMTAQKRTSAEVQSSSHVEKSCVKRMNLGDASANLTNDASVGTTLMSDTNDINNTSSNDADEEEDNVIDNEYADNDLLGDDENPHHVATGGGGHFLGVQPLGNAFFSDNGNCRDAGLGMFARFSDSFLLENIFSFLDGKDLARVSSVSKAFYAFSYAPDVDLWRPLVLDLTQGRTFDFQYYWRETYAYEYKLLQYQKAQKALETTNTTTTQTVIEKPVSCTSPPIPPLKLKSFFSDELFQPWYCGNALDANQDDWDMEYNIERVDARTLSVEDFHRRFAEPCKPVVLTGIVGEWAAKNGAWAVEALKKDPRLSNTFFTCGAADMTISQYLTYAERCINDEAPIYLFDKRFGEKVPALLEDYRVPKFFTDDFYTLVPKEHRPSFRWWLIGPARSGSSFHKDPLYTHAWNGLVSGKKKWILYPPHITPPGIICSPDHLEVVAPLSVAEWYLSFYHQTKVSERKWRNRPTSRHISEKAKTNVTNETEETKLDSVDVNEDEEEYDHIRDFPRKCESFESYRPVEIMQCPGEVVFIPSQWWHSAVNYEFSIAVTQNILHSSNYLDGIKFLTKLKQHALRDAVEELVDQKYPTLKADLERRRQEEREQRTLRDRKLAEKRIKGDNSKEQIGKNDIDASAASAVSSISADSVQSMAGENHAAVHVTAHSAVSADLATFFHKHRVETAEIEAVVKRGLGAGSTESPSCSAAADLGANISEFSLDTVQEFSFGFAFGGDDENGGE